MAGNPAFMARVFLPASGAVAISREPLEANVNSRQFSVADFSKSIWDESQASSFVFYRSGIGVSTAFTDEAMQAIGTSTTLFEITDVLKSYFDDAATFSVEDANGTVAPADYTIDYVRGEVTFNSAPATPVMITGSAFNLSVYSPPATINRNYLAGRLEFPTAQTGRKFKVNGFYFPRTGVIGARSYNITMNADMLEDTDFENTSLNGGNRTFQYGLLTGTISLERIDDFSRTLKNSLINRIELLIDVTPKSGSSFRGWFLPSQADSQGSVEDLETESLTFNLNTVKKDYIALINL